MMEKNPAIEAARDRGAAAFATGQGIKQNPYKSRVGFGPAFKNAWRDGWRQAAKAKARCIEGHATHDFVSMGDCGADVCARDGCEVVRF